MKKRNWKRIFSCALLAALVLALAVSVPRAARGFGDFDSGSDYGGSGGWGGGSDSWSSSDSDSDDLDLLWLIQIVGDIGQIFGIRSPVVSILLAVGIFVAVKYVLPALFGRKSKPKHEGIRRANLYRPHSLLTLREKDPDFDQNALLDRVRDLYEKMQLCWEQGDIVPLRKDFMPDTWTRFNTQLQNKNAAGETSHVRDIQFGQVALQSFTTDQEHQILKIKIEVTHNIWTTDAEGNNILGTEHTRKRFEFLWTMMRPLDAVTGGNKPADPGHCPNCGAEIDLESFAECPFCHTPFMKVAPDWVISEIDALSQTTLHQ